MNNFKYFLLVLFLLTPDFIYANKHEYSSVNLINNKDEIAIKIKLEDGWKIYGPNISQFGQPTKLTFKKSSNIKNIIAIWPLAETTEELGSRTYQKEVIIPLKFDFYNQKTKKVFIDLDYSYVLCKDMCIPINGSLNKTLDLTENINIPNLKINYSLFYILIISLVGGFILNFMPCVLPIVSLKIYGLVKAQNSNSSKKHLIAMVLGIVFTFIAIALFTISLKKIGQFYGLHVHFQQPIFIITLFLVLVIFITNLQGLIQISLPEWTNNFLNSKLLDNKKFIGDFLSGVVSAILATPCTAPFVTIALTYALTQKNIIILTIFLFLSIGFSLPYIIFIIYPSLLKLLPKPGKWMSKFKNIIALFLSLTCLWLLYIFSSQTDIKSAIILFLIGLLLKFILSKKVRFKYIIIIIILVLSYMLPQKIFKNDLLSKNKIDKTWQAYKTNEISQLISDNKIIIVDITADWCMTCKLNKFLVLDNVEILDELKLNKNIIFMRKDITSSIDKETNLLLKEHERHGIPLNIIYSSFYPKGILLPILITKSDLTKAIRMASGN